MDDTVQRREGAGRWPFDKVATRTDMGVTWTDMGATRTDMGAIAEQMDAGLTDIPQVAPIPA